MGSSQSRKNLLTINNPADKGYDHKTIQEILASLKVSYYCLSDEIGENGTYHTHIFIYRKSPIRFDTLLRKFPGAHIDTAYGSCLENRDYVAKSGKWAKDKKSETSVLGTFIEWGEMPDERNENNPSNADLIAAIESGKSTSDIIRENPSFIFRSNDIGVLKETLLADKYMVEQREIEVIYIYGPSGAGKTRSIFDSHPASDICRITDYSGASGVRFDGYHGHAVLVFEEFHSQIPIAPMLNFLDRYPIRLPARYSDRVACFTTVYITSNLPLSQQYTQEQAYRPEVWKAFLRRITQVVEYSSDGSKVERNAAEYL